MCEFARGYEDERCGAVPIPSVAAFQIAARCSDGMGAIRTLLDPVFLLAAAATASSLPPLSGLWEYQC